MTNHSSKLPDLSCTEIIKKLIPQESEFAKTCAYTIIAYQMEKLLLVYFK